MMRTFFFSYLYKFGNVIETSLLIFYFLPLSSLHPRSQEEPNIKHFKTYFTNLYYFIIATITIITTTIIFIYTFITFFSYHFLLRCYIFFPKQAFIHPSLSIYTSSFLLFSISSSYKTASIHPSIHTSICFCSPLYNLNFLFIFFDKKSFYLYMFS